MKTKPHHVSKLLVVNDDPASLLALTSLLDQWSEATGYRVFTAQSGTDALRQVLLHDFAVVLLDVNMPGMNGFETAFAIRQRARSADIPIIFVTAFMADEIARLQAYDQGAADFLFTPIVPEILHAKVSTFVALAAKNEQLRLQADELAERSSELTAANRRLSTEIGERQAAERESTAKDEFLALLGHELRNPLSAITSASALLGMPQSTAETHARARGIIGRQARHLAGMVEKILDLSRAMSGKIVLAACIVDLESLVAGCVHAFRATADAERLQIDVDVVPAFVIGDPARLAQIVSSLLDNALKYTPPDGRIGVVLRPDGADAVLSVSDSGAGIEPGLLPHIFDTFVQGAVPLDRSQGGLGIGLSLVRHLAELHHGAVTAASPGRGCGSTFTFRMPIGTAPAAAPSVPPAQTDRHGKANALK